jgi:hypothetical protein
MAMQLHYGWVGNHPRFHASVMNDLLHRHGATVEWEQGIICNCWGTVDNGVLTYQTREPDPYCGTCQGEGFSYLPPIVFDGVVLQQFDFNLMFNIMGQYEDGDVQLTVASDTPIWSRGTQGDRITLMDRVITQSEKIQHGNDILRYVPASVETVQWGNTIYRPGIDYQVVNDEIIWIGNEPPADAWYGVRFQIYPTYQLWLRLPEPRVIDRENLPETWWVVYRESYKKRIKEGPPKPPTFAGNSGDVPSSNFGDAIGFDGSFRIGGEI